MTAQNKTIFSAEEQEEIRFLTSLSANQADGLLVLKPANIAMPMKKFTKQVPLPLEFTDIDEFVDSFIEWQIPRRPKADQVRWGTTEARDDVKLYVVRKIWDAKVAAGSVHNTIARATATVSDICRHQRTDFHESINSAIKHNPEHAEMLKAHADRIDEAMKFNTAKAIEFVANTACRTLPELQEILLRPQLEHRPEAAPEA